MPDLSTTQGRPSLIDLQEHEDRLALLTAARAGDPAAIQTLADRYHVRISGTVPTARPQEAAVMSELATCDVCGKEVKRQGLGVHKARAHPDGNGSVASRPSIPRGTVTVTTAAQQAVCDQCPFRGLESHVAKALVTQAVQAGMELESAAAFVRQAQAAFKK